MTEQLSIVFTERSVSTTGQTDNANGPVANNQRKNACRLNLQDVNHAFENRRVKLIRVQSIATDDLPRCKRQSGRGPVHWDRFPLAEHSGSVGRLDPVNA